MICLHLLCWFRICGKTYTDEAIKKLEEIAHRHFVRIDYLLPVSFAGQKTEIEAFLKEVLASSVLDVNKFMKGVRDNSFDLDHVLSDGFNIIDEGWLEKERSRVLVDKYDIKYLAQVNNLEVMLFSLMPFLTFTDHKIKTGEDFI